MRDRVNLSLIIISLSNYYSVFDFPPVFSSSPVVEEHEGDEGVECREEDAVGENDAGNKRRLKGRQSQKDRLSTTITRAGASLRCLYSLRCARYSAAVLYLLLALLLSLLLLCLLFFAPPPPPPLWFKLVLLLLLLAIMADASVVASASVSLKEGNRLRTVLVRVSKKR